MDWSTEATNCDGGGGCLSAAEKREKKGVELGSCRRAGAAWKEGERAAIMGLSMQVRRRLTCHVGRAIGGGEKRKERREEGRGR